MKSNLKVFLLDSNLTMAPTIVALWYLPHERYGRYHNLLFEISVIFKRIKDSFLNTCKDTQNK